MSERFSVSGSTIVTVSLASQFYAMALAALLFQEWWWVGWFGIPFVPLAVWTFYMLLPRNSPRLKVEEP